MADLQVPLGDVRQTERSHEITRHFVTVSPRRCGEIFQPALLPLSGSPHKDKRAKPWKQRWHSPAPAAVAAYRISLSRLISSEAMTRMRAKDSYFMHTVSGDVRCEAFPAPSVKDNMNLWIMAGKNPGNLLTPAVTSSLGGTSITASNVTIRAAGCFNAIRLRGKFKAAFERGATAALHADSGSPEEEREKAELDSPRCARIWHVGGWACEDFRYIFEGEQKQGVAALLCLVLAEVASHFVNTENQSKPLNDAHLQRTLSEKKRWILSVL